MDEVLKITNKTEIDNAIEMFENAMKTQVHQWLTTTDLLCVLYLLKDMENKLDALRQRET